MLYICKLYPWDPGYKGTMTAEEARALILERKRYPYVYEKTTATVEKKDSVQVVPTRAREETKEVHETKVRAVRIDFTGEKFVICVKLCLKESDGNSDGGIWEYVWLETVLDDIVFLLTETALVRAIRKRRMTRVFEH